MASNNIINDVNKNKNYKEISEYIINKFSEITIEEARKITSRLVNLDEFTLDVILNSSIDNIISNYINFYKIRYNSVKLINEEINEIPLKSIKESIDPKVINILLDYTREVAKYFGYINEESNGI